MLEGSELSAEELGNLGELAVNLAENDEQQRMAEDIKSLLIKEI